MKKSWHTLFAGASLIIAASLVYFPSSSALTEESEVDVRFTFNPMLTLSVSSADIIIPNLIPGTSDNSNTVAVTVNTNNISGYSLSATVGNTTNSSRNLVHTALNTNLFSSIDTSSNITSFTTDNTWGYSIDDGAHYSGLPIYTDTPKEIKKTTEAGNSYTNFLIGAKASSTQISGDYTNVINFTAVTNYAPLTWEIAYENAGKTKTDGYYSIQDADSRMCSIVDAGETIIVRDARDGETYLIGKLADDKCWLLDNLRLDLTNETVINTLSSSNTNIDPFMETDILKSLKEGNRAAGDQYATAGLAKTNWTSSQSYTIPLLNIEGTFNDSPYTKDSIVTSYGNGSGKIGIYYNYCAASAGSYCWNSSGPSSDPVPSSGYDIASDICPANWRMPTGGEVDTTVTPNQGEYQLLFEAYNSNRDGYKNALSTPLSGRLNNGTAEGQGSYGNFWTSSWKDANEMRHANIQATYVYPRTYDVRYRGNSVRCVIK